MFSSHFLSDLCFVDGLFIYLFFFIADWRRPDMCVSLPSVQLKMGGIGACNETDVRDGGPNV